MGIKTLQPHQKSNSRLIEIAHSLNKIREAQQNKKYSDPQKHVAAVLTPNHIIYKNIIGFNTPQVHAEGAIYKKLNENITSKELRGSLHLFVSRDGLKNSRPCQNCSHLIIESGLFSKIYWTAGNGEIEYSTPNGLLSEGVKISKGHTHSSSCCMENEDNEDSDPAKPRKI
jgi:hypothetical protein